MRKCPKCFRSHIALQVVKIGHDYRSGICDECIIPESDDHVLIGQTIIDGEIIIEVDLSGHGEIN